MTWATRLRASGSSAGEMLMLPAALAILLGREFGESYQKPASKSKTDAQGLPWMSRGYNSTLPM